MALLAGKRVFVLKNVRVIFSKTGRAKFVSHLDLVRTMSRAVRRAGIPLWYTEGFNRHPYLTFAAPLSLGYEGLRESMDFRLEEEMDGDTIVERFNDVFPEGIRAIAADEASAKAKELMAAEYRMTIGCAAEDVQALLSSSEILVEKRTKKKTMKTMDIRPYFANAVVESADSSSSVMMVTLPCGSAENINPGLILSALGAVTGREVEADVVRLRLLKADGTEFL